jgi:hypothetical protein
MKKEFNICSEGVLVLASKTGLAEYYADKKFDYDYPEGLMGLINSGIISAITTESGEELKVRITDQDITDLESFEKIGLYNLNIQTEDSIYILGHAEFTQICNWKKGKIEDYDFPESPVFISDFKTGWYEITIFAKEVEFDDEEEEEEFQFEIEVILHFKSIINQSIAQLDDVLRI